MRSMVFGNIIVRNANGCFLLRLMNMRQPRLFLRLITIPRKPKTSTQPKHNPDLSSQEKTISHLIRTGQISQAREAFDNMKQRDTVTWNQMITGYAKRGEMVNARKLFDEMPERDIISWNVMIWGYTSCRGRGYIEEARRLFYKMPKRDSVSWSTMISGYAKNGRIGKALKLFNTMPEKSVGAWNAMITGFLQNGDLVHAFEFFERMPKRDCFSWTAMISGLAKNGKMGQALKLFNIMPERNVVSWNAMITGFLQNGDLLRAMKFFERMPKRDCFSWTTMISGLANNGKMNEALKLFNSMPERNVVSWCAMITGLLRNGDVVRAIEFFESMPQRDGDSLAALVSGLIQNGELDEATRIARDCRNREEGMRGLVKAYNTLIVGYGEMGRVEEARQLFDQIPLMHNKGNNGRRFERNIVSWNSMIMCYLKAGYVLSARELFDQMIDRDTISWTTMISGYVHVSDMQEASNLFRKMPNPDTMAWTSMIEGYVQVGRLDLANDFFEKMPRKVLICWSFMIAGYEKKGDISGAVKLFSQMQLEGEKPDRYTLSSMLKVCIGSVDLHLGMQIHQLVTKSGFAEMPLNNSLITMYSQCGALKMAEKMFEEVKLHKDLISWNTMIAGYGYHGFAEEALELFTLMKDSKVQPTNRTVKAVLYACKRGGLVKEGKSRTEQYASLVDIIGRHGHLEEAMDLINRMPCKPDKAVWGALLGASRVHNNIELAKVAAEALTRLEPESSAPYVLLYNMYRDAGLWDEAAALKSVMG